LVIDQKTHLNSIRIRPPNPNVLLYNINASSKITFPLTHKE
jgi:hypothetical protein